MRTQRTLRGQIAPEILDAIANGTASEDLRAAYRLQLQSAQNEPLRAAGIETQTNWVDGPASEAGGQSLLF